VDLVFTSPPYASALDYTRAHIFSVAWLTERLGISLDDYRNLGRSYIGSDRGPHIGIKNHHAPVVTLCDELVGLLKEQDPDHALTLKRYFVDMQQVFAECNRVLKPGGRCVVVVCPSHLRKVPIPTQEVFVSMGEVLKKGSSHHLSLESVRTRIIDDGRRLMPYLQSAFGHRMRVEYVLVLRKSPTW
jgi:hypothetical protein